MPRRHKKKGGKTAHQDEEDKHHGLDPPAKHPVSSSLRGSETLKMKKHGKGEESSDEIEEESEDEEKAGTTTASAEATNSDQVSSSQQQDDTDVEKTAQTEQKARHQLASISEVFSYGRGRTKLLCLTFGFMLAAVSGAVPIGIIFYFAKAFEDLVADPNNADFMDPIRKLAYAFLILGIIAFCSLCGYATLLESSAGFMTQDFKKQWFQALLRQDMAYFDIQDVSGVATLISANASKYKR